MYFDNTTPEQEYFTPLLQATGADRRGLALLGYKSDGTQNTWGKITSWVPGLGLGNNIRAKELASNAGLNQVAGNIADDTANRQAKLMAQLSIIGGVAGIASGGAGVIGGIENIGKGIASVSGLQGPNRADDGTSLLY